MITRIEELNKLSFFAFPRLFSSLEPPDRDVLRGSFRGTFVGPTWLRRLAGPLLTITALAERAMSRVS